MSNQFNVSEYYGFAGHDKRLRAHPASAPYLELITSSAGEVWAGNELTPQQKCLVTVATLATLGRTTPLKVHLRGALHLGLTAPALVEAVEHVAVYAGIATANEALAILNEVLLAETTSS